MSLLQMSFSGAVMILAIIMVRALAINKLPKRVFLILWELVLLRLLVPFSIPSVLSVYSFLSRSVPVSEVQDRIAMENIPQVTTEPIKIYERVNPVMQNESSDLSIWAGIWVIGILLCAGYFIIAYLRCRAEFQMSLPVKNEFVNGWLREHQLKRSITIRQSDRISAPLTYGVLHPVILMPKNTDWENRQQLQYILMHEYIHIRRFDTLYKLIATLVLSIHWLNPFVWVMYTLYNRDIELSCDESVVRQFGDGFRSTYARTLITMEETRSGLRPFCNNFSKNAIEERITAIMKTKKLTIGLCVISAAVIVAIVVLFATSAKSSSNDTVEGIVAEGIEVPDTVLEAAKQVDEITYPYAVISREESFDELLKEYEKYGITCENDSLYYHGELVRYFLDGYESENDDGGINTISRYSSYNGLGTIDVHVVYSDTQNEDGSTALFGQIVDIVPYSQEAFDAREFQTSDEIVATTEYSGTVEGSIDDTATMESDTENVGRSADAVTYASEQGASGQTVKKILKQYEKFGITYQEVNDNQGNIYLNGQLLESFLDEKPDGSIFLCQSKDGGTGVACTVYNEQGKLVNVVLQTSKIKE